MSKFKARIDYVMKHNVWISKIIRFFGSICLRTAGFFVKTDNQSVLFSGHNKAFNDSPKAIYLKMISSPLFSNFKFYWAVDDMSTRIPGGCIKVKTDTIKYFITSFKCKYWIACVNIERSFRYKKRKQIYLNTGHGITIKTCGNDAKGRKDYNFSHVDYFCISSEYERQIYINAFKLNPSSIIETGLPRNEELFSFTNDEALKIKRRLNIPQDKKVILYAPTWRDSSDGGKTFSIAPPISFETWEKRLGKNFIILLRTHPCTNKELDVKFDDCIRDVSRYKDVNDLIEVSDYLVSDYSAIIFDYAITERPIICFAYDYEEYSKARGLELDLNAEIPNGVISTESGVIDLIMNGDYEDLCNRTKQFKRKYVNYGQNATDLCIKKLFGDRSE